MKSSFKLPNTFWAGFSEGKIDLHHYDCGAEPPYGILYTNKRDAQKRYEDVRRVELVEVKRGR